MTGGDATTRTLVVVRHAKAEAGAGTDHERSLTDRGRRDAAASGRWLAGCGLTPDAALVSDAARTRETWTEIAAAAGWGLEADVDRAVYTAEIDSAFDLIRALDDGVETALIVGHNPTAGSLAHLLDDGTGDPEAVTRLLSRGFPTSAAAVFEVAGSWASLAEGGGALRGFHAGHAE